MPDSDQNSRKKAKIYIYLALAFCVLLVYAAVFGHIAGNPRLIFGSFMLLVLLFFSYFSVSKVFLGLIILIPFIIGTDAYQINIGSFLRNFLPIKDLYVNPFSITCLAIVFYACMELLKKGREIFRIPLIFVLPISTALSLIIFLGSEYKIDGLVFELYLIAGFMAYFLGYIFLGSKKGYMKLLMSVVLSAIIPMIFAVSQLLMGNYMYEGDSGLGRIRGSFPHSNTFGSYLFVVITVMAIAFFAVKFKNNEKHGKEEKIIVLSKIIPIAVLSLFLILTYSRTAWIGVALSMAAIAIVRPYFRIPLIYFGSLATALILIFERTRERILEIFDRHMFDSMYGRYEIWDMALFAAKKSPILGYGIGTFEEIIRKVQGKETGNVYPHNDFIRFFLEGGILGVVLYVLYMLGAIYYSARSYLKYPKGEETIHFLGADLSVDFRMLGMIPLLLFAIMVPISFVEAPSMDFVYQIFAWTMLGSWLGMSRESVKNSENYIS